MKLQKTYKIRMAIKAKGKGSVNRAVTQFSLHYRNLPYLSFFHLQKRFFQNNLRNNLYANSYCLSFPSPSNRSYLCPKKQDMSDFSYYPLYIHHLIIPI